MADRVSVPAEVVALKLLDRVDYGDAFTIGNAGQQPPEFWVRHALGGVSPALIGLVRRVQQGLGLRLAAESHEHPLGWDILHSGPEAFILGAEGRLGSARIISTTPPNKVVVTTLLRFDSAASRAAWILVAPLHRAVAHYLLDHAAKVTTAGRAMGVQK